MEPNPIRNLAGAFWYIHKYLTIAKPELIPEWMTYFGKTGNEICEFLDANFPVPDGWKSKDMRETRNLMMEFHPYGKDDRKLEG